jgi:hypothetical protein
VSKWLDPDGDGKSPFLSYTTDTFDVYYAADFDLGLATLAPFYSENPYDYRPALYHEWYSELFYQVLGEQYGQVPAARAFLDEGTGVAVEAVAPPAAELAVAVDGDAYTIRLDAVIETQVMKTNSSNVADGATDQAYTGSYSPLGPVTVSLPGLSAASWGGEAIPVGEGGSVTVSVDRLAGLTLVAGEAPPPDGSGVPGEADVAAPVISNARVTDVTEAGYWVRFDVEDDSGAVAWVLVGAFTADGWADDIAWADAAKDASPGAGDGAYTLYVSAQDHGGAQGEYDTVIWAYDAAGNAAFAWAPAAFVSAGPPDVTPPVISNIHVGSTEGGYHVGFDAADDSGAVAWAPVGAFTVDGWADDIVWVDAQVVNGEYSAYVMVADHGGSPGPYQGVIWVYDAAGNGSFAWIYADADTPACVDCV